MWECLKAIQKYQKYRNYRALLMIWSLGWLLACQPTKYVPTDKYLLDKYQFKSDNKAFKAQDLKPLVKQKPNKRILWLRFHLGMYNFSDTEKSNGLNNWLRKIGEEPVVYDSQIQEKTRLQLRQYLQNSGYFEAEVTDTVLLRKQRADIVFRVRSGKPHYVSTIRYELEDTSLAKFVLPDTLNSLVKSGDILNLDKLYLETERLETNLKNQGYKDFNKLFVFFAVDTLSQPYLANLTCNIKAMPVQGKQTFPATEPHKRFYIDKIVVKEQLSDKKTYRTSKADTIYTKGYAFYRIHKGNINTDLIRRLIAFTPGAYFSAEGTDLTYRNLSSIRIYKTIGIQYQTPDLPYNDSLKAWPLTCTLLLTPTTRQGYSTELEATNSGGDIGVGGNLLYQHKNLFGAAENLDIRLNGAVEFLQKTDDRKIENTLELGAKTSLTLHQFLLPIRSVEFTKKYNPKTVFSVSYNFHRRPDYTRTITSFSFGYIWRGGLLNSHKLNLIEVNTVDTVNVSTEFWNRISRNPYLSNSYRNHFIYASNYSFVHNTQKQKGNLRYFFLRFNFETAGNLISVFNKMLDQPQDSAGYYTFLNREYSQYFKTDLDIRRSFPVNSTDNIVFRAFGGVGLPQGNSLALPFDRSYYAGGANSIRAWKLRDLGPGSYPGDSTSLVPYQSGDIKMEANIEYRFKLFWILEGAIFADAGNIWAISDKDNRANARFEWNRFYKEIAIGGGIGLRFNLNYVLFRTDFAFQMRDPAMPDGQRIVLLNNDWFNRFNFNFGIGYPF